MKGGVADALLFFLLQFPLLLRFWILDSTLLDSAFCVRCTLYLDSHWTTPDHIRLIFMFESTHPPRLSLDPDLDLGFGELDLDMDSLSPLVVDRIGPTSTSISNPPTGHIIK